MNASDKMISSSNTPAEFDRRNHAANEILFPLIDSNGETIEKERRLDASIYLGKIKAVESQLSEEEFALLFNL